MRAARYRYVGLHLAVGILLQACAAATADDVAQGEPHSTTAGTTHNVALIVVGASDEVGGDEVGSTAQAMKAALVEAARRGWHLVSWAPENRQIAELERDYSMVRDEVGALLREYGAADVNAQLASLDQLTKDLRRVVSGGNVLANPPRRSSIAAVFVRKERWWDDFAHDVLIVTPQYRAVQQLGWLTLNSEFARRFAEGTVPAFRHATVYGESDANAAVKRRIETLINESLVAPTPARNARARWERFLNAVEPFDERKAQKIYFATAMAITAAVGGVTFLVGIRLANDGDVDDEDPEPHKDPLDREPSTAP